VLALAILFADGAAAQAHFYRINAPRALAAQAYAPVMTYLNSTTMATVTADPKLSQYIPIYTSDYAPNNAYLKFYLYSPAQQPADVLVIDRVANDNPRPQGTLKTTVAGRFEVYSLR
jgi:hypothetical protein